MAGNIERERVPRMGETAFLGHVLSSEDGRYDLGDSTHRWRRLFVKEINVSQVTYVTEPAIDADTVDGFHADSTPTAGYLLALDGSLHFPSSTYAEAVLVDGTRPLTSNWDVGSYSITATGLTINGDIVVSGTVDGVDVADHSARHDPGGADALTTAAASDVSLQSNAEGSAASLARSDHLHHLAESIVPTWTGKHTWGTNTEINFRDTALRIYSSADGQLDIDADVALEIVAPTVAITGELALDGDLDFIGPQEISTSSGDLTLAPTGDLIVGGDVIFPDAASISTSSGNLTIDPAGDIVLNPTGNDVLPESNYDINLGSLSTKYLSLHAAELWVETLVAQDTIATIGGRILVGPTTILAADMSGTSIISNGGFETAGGGGDDVFANWQEAKGDGTISDETSIVYTGSHSCKFTMGATYNSQIYQNKGGMTAGDWYYLEFASRGDGTYQGQYYIYDATNYAPIIDWTNTGITAASWGTVSDMFQIPAGCTTITAILRGPQASGGVCYFDAYSIVTADVAVEHNGMEVDDIAYMESNGKVEFVQITEGPSGSGPYYYAIDRNLDGTGLNDWYAGDAIFNTGQSGDGFIDLYSRRGVKSSGVLEDESGATWGPTVHALSFDTTALFRPENVDLSPFAGVEGTSTPYMLILRDSNGNEAVGYIGAADTGLTVGSDICVNGGFETFTGTADDDTADDFDTWGEAGGRTEAVTVAYAGSYACKMGYVGSAPYMSQTFSVTAGALYRVLFYTRGDGGAYEGKMTFQDLTNNEWIFSPWIGLSNTGTSYSVRTYYVTIPAGCTSLSLNFVGPLNSGNYHLLDAVQFEPVTHTSAEGVHIVNSLDGSTRGWASEMDGFNRNDSSYTFEVRSTAGGIGPTIVGNVRNSSTYNDWTEHWAIGNLNGLYGYGSDTYGIGLGKYSGADYMTIDATNGIRFFDSSDNVQGELSSGAWTLGYISGGEYLTIDTSGIEIFAGGVKTIDIDSSGDFIFGQVNDNLANLFWDQSEGKLSFRGGSGGTVVGAYIDTDGSFVSGSDDVVINSDGIVIAAGTDTWNELRWEYSGSDAFSIAVYGTTNTVVDIYATATGAGTDSYVNVGPNVGAGYSGIYLRQSSTTSNCKAAFVVNNGFEIECFTDRIDFNDPIHGYSYVRGTYFQATDGISAPSGTSGQASIYVDTSDSVLKVRHGTGTPIPLEAPILLTTPLESSNWNGDTFSDVSTSTQLDLSSEFGVPAGVKAVIMTAQVYDTGGAGDYWFCCGPSSTYYYTIVSYSNSASTYCNSTPSIVKCDSNGDVWYRIEASGSSTMHIWIRIWGYWI